MGIGVGIGAAVWGQTTHSVRIMVPNTRFGPGFGGSASGGQSPRFGPGGFVGTTPSIRVPGIGGIGGLGGTTGTVTSVSGTTLRVKEPTGKTVTVKVPSSVKITKTSTGSLSDLTPGTCVRVAAPSTGSTPTARSVVILPTAGSTCS